MAPESVIEKIRKLLSLKEGAEKIGSLEEAANAAEKAQNLLIKHNLEMADVSRHGPKSKMGKASLTNVYAKKNEGQWIYSLYQVLAINNFCDVVFTRTMIDDHQLIRYVNLIGTKDNVEMVKFLAEQLEMRIRALEDKAWKDGKKYGEKRNSFRRGYFMGATRGIDAQLKESKRRAMQDNSQVNALVIVNDKELMETVNKMFPNLRTGKRKRNLKSEVGTYMGYNDGKSMSIHKGVGNSGTKNSIQG